MTRLRMSSEELRKLLLEAVRLAGEHNEDFDEVKLANRTKIKLEHLRELLSNNSLASFFEKSRKTNLKCQCGSDVEIEKELDYAICKDCNDQVNFENEGVLCLGLKIGAVEEFFIEFITEKFIEKDFVERDSDKNFTALKNKKNGECLALSVSIERNGLRNYFSLCGWANEYNPSTCIVVSNSFDKYLQSYKDKDLKCTLINFLEICDDTFIDRLLEDVREKRRILKDQKETEKKLKLEFRKFGEIDELEKNHQDIVDSITKRALQIMDESVKMQASKFEKDIVKILNFTILRTKYLGGNNQPDGLGMVLRQDNQRSKWYPIEIKSFTPENESKPFYPLKKATTQITKYIKAFQNEEIKIQFDIPAFILIAYDFDINNKEEEKLIEEFENTHKTKLVLFPLKPMIRLLVGFHDNNIFHIPSDDIQKFIVKSNYVKTEQVDELITELVKKNKEKYKEPLKIVGAKVKVQGI